MYPKELTVKQIESKLNTLPKDYLLFHFPKFDGQIMDGEKQNVFKSSLDQSPMVDKDVALPDLSEDLSYLNLEVRLHIVSVIEISNKLLIKYLFVGTTTE